MPSPTIQELRAKYRTVLNEGGYNPATLRQRCEIYMRTRAITLSPQAWVSAAEHILSQDEYEEEHGVYEGYEGTGMSEADYFRALGSME